MLHRQHQDSAGEADTLDSLGLIAQRREDHRQAVNYYRQALSLLRTLGDAYLIAETLDNVGHSYAALGSHMQAHTVWQEALELYRDQGRNNDALRVQQQIGELDTAAGSR